MTPKKMFTFNPNRQDSIGFAAAHSLLLIISKKGLPTKERKWTECQRNCLLVTEKLPALHLRHVELEKDSNLNLNESQKILTQILSHRGNRV